jgi:hypothetical protein
VFKFNSQIRIQVPIPMPPGLQPSERVQFWKSFFNERWSDTICATTTALGRFNKGSPFGLSLLASTIDASHPVESVERQLMETFRRLLLSQCRQIQRSPSATDPYEYNSVIDVSESLFEFVPFFVCSTVAESVTNSA